MADCKKKGILKSSSSFEKTETYRCGTKEMKWDEMNILQTLHPPDKDYGHMKIEEPKTPFSHYRDPEDGTQERTDPHSDDETDGFDPDLLAKKIDTLPGNALPKALQEAEEEDDDDDELYADETEEERAKRKTFEQKRKQHYNEFYAVKLARKLMEKDEDDDDEEEGSSNNDDHEDSNEEEDEKNGVSIEDSTHPGDEKSREHHTSEHS